MPKLKALRGAIGSYGRVAAGGIIDVDQAAEQKLLKTKRFVAATAEDIAAAQKAQKRYLKLNLPGVPAGFPAIAGAAAADAEATAKAEVDEKAKPGAEAKAKADAEAKAKADAEAKAAKASK